MELKPLCLKKIKMEATVMNECYCEIKHLEFQREHGALPVVSTSSNRVAVECNRTGCELTGSVLWFSRYKLRVKLKMKQSFYPYKRDIQMEVSAEK
jgi:hypothetical protein